MPIYEFYCDKCNTIFNFLSKKIDTTTNPSCPKCKSGELPRRPSSFSMISKGNDRQQTVVGEPEEAKLEAAFREMMVGVKNMDEADPQRLVGLMREFSRSAGVKLAAPMEEAVSRLESGEDPALVESELGEFLMEYGELGQIITRRSGTTEEPTYDETLYEL